MFITEFTKTHQHSAFTRYILLQEGAILGDLKKKKRFQGYGMSIYCGSPDGITEGSISIS